MQDEPKPAEILAAVAAFLREEVQPHLKGNTAFQLRVAINALELVRRECGITVEQGAHENALLAKVLAMEGETMTLTGELARRIAARQIDPFAPDVAACLWTITEAKLEVDQPTYGGLTRARAKLAVAEKEMDR
ncbi:DUF6285 domain-containing protein [Novosphingobium cyanobacteriorum]|uniref:DUF6285 domain-containing protein n=1 Tax=Novosphingobium cyanobacteriorum TaxID=3024215 RepID=A0ABT6CP70_9SPHN|nr:DUF6285 domain-containing protein [Novosphingobium cyanobacteriorum]MDF8335667.1 DUF6285 domain-containing protein [Novosphingobium cyanobacteriorum]